MPFSDLLRDVDVARSRKSSSTATRSLTLTDGRPCAPRRRPTTSRRTRPSCRAREEGRAHRRAAGSEQTAYSYGALLLGLGVHRVSGRSRCIASPPDGFRRSRARRARPIQEVHRHVRRRRRRGRSQGGGEGNRRFPARARPLCRDRRPDPEGRAAGRASRHRQDAAGAIDRRRSQGAVPVRQRLGLRRDVRRRRRLAHPQAVQATRAATRPASSSSTSSTPSAAAAAATRSATRSASRRSTSCSSRWTASRRTRASSSSRRPTGRTSSIPRCSRPGRFDRQVTVGAPDLKGREQILRIHARKVALDAGRGPAADRARHARLLRAPTSRTSSTRRRCSRCARGRQHGRRSRSRSGARQGADGRRAAIAAR